MQELSIKDILEIEHRNSSFINTAPILETYEYRYLPKSILQKSMSDYLIYENAPKVLEYILNAFYIYRDAVNRNMFAPFVLKDGAYEWLDNASFNWTDMKTVVAVGQSIHNRAPQREHPSEHPIRYKFDNSSKLGILFSEDWRVASLRKYANPITYTLIDWKTSKSNPEKTFNSVHHFLASLEDYMILD